MGVAGARIGCPIFLGVERGAELAGEVGEGGGVQGGGLEVEFELASKAAAIVEAEHAERAGELVGD
jgi:hypothetical protein